MGLLRMTAYCFFWETTRLSPMMGHLPGLSENDSMLTFSADRQRPNWNDNKHTQRSWHTGHSCALCSSGKMKLKHFFKHHVFSNIQNIREGKSAGNVTSKQKPKVDKQSMWQNTEAMKVLVNSVPTIQALKASWVTMRQHTQKLWKFYLRALGKRQNKNDKDTIGEFWSKNYTQVSVACMHVLYV